MSFRVALNLGARRRAVAAPPHRAARCPSSPTARSAQPRPRHPHRPLGRASSGCCGLAVVGLRPCRPSRRSGRSVARRGPWRCRVVMSSRVHGGGATHVARRRGAPPSGRRANPPDVSGLRRRDVESAVRPAARARRLRPRSRLDDGAGRPARRRAARSARAASSACCASTRRRWPTAAHAACGEREPLGGRKRIGRLGVAHRPPAVPLANVRRPAASRSRAPAVSTARATARPRRAGSAPSPSTASRIQWEPSGRPTNARQGSASLVQPRVGADRRVAGGLERRHQRALGRQAQPARRGR